MKAQVHGILLDITKLFLKQFQLKTYTNIFQVEIEFSSKTLKKTQNNLFQIEKKKKSKLRFETVRSGVTRVLSPLVKLGALYKIFCAPFYGIFRVFQTGAGAKAPLVMPLTIRPTIFIFL